jgi:hypothetical protein
MTAKEASRLESTTHLPLLSADTLDGKEMSQSHRLSAMIGVGLFLVAVFGILVRSLLASQCREDRDCKLIYSSCSCAAVPVTAQGRTLESNAVCVVNRCTYEHVEPVCIAGACSEKKPSDDHGSE